ncbi:putative toxin-antitoxin system toxin component, PIN family [Candidatus Curtissbacteria bacterium RIFCSPHIGHO2_12_FULL_38_9b]|uniref:Putative toxin-antitoxin system toxin component, PIN family n=2 Tax=Candidatus Curtissiibacteriota TaxID=1752717 RepID=A0A1F5GTK1_9BACT|nr:MAG: putative toxin-antitoxin system toxin component, PIN family [Candidatus Curtissbacteria bacterium RIFCSPHIGHO2_12_FULL_38_9b]OGD95675.1 MAG: putative toxin-antitoxin system toxin component, PIN family [Candidatus Curtissbacteria bacterium RIFCSPLOWO2_01_FULL_37_9]
MLAFIDASVILAALGSKSGGSSQVLKLVRKRKIDGVTSQAVVEEVFRNANKIKITESEVSRLISSSSLKVIPAPISEEVEKYLSVTVEKDAHVVASAIKSKANIIITLDKKHLLSKGIKGIDVVSPGEFLQKL